VIVFGRIFLLTVAIIAVQGQIIPETIKADVSKLAHIYRLYLESISSTMIKDLEDERCPWMLECCPNEIGRFFPLMMANKFQQKCRASSGDKVTSSGSTCKEAIEEFTQSTNPNYKDLTNILNFSPIGFTAMKQWEELANKKCTVEELQPLYCTSSRFETIQPCMQKVFNSIARKNDIAYGIFITKLIAELGMFMPTFRASSLANKLNPFA